MIISFIFSSNLDMFFNYRYLLNIKNQNNIFLNFILLFLFYSKIILPKKKKKTIVFIYNNHSHACFHKNKIALILFLFVNKKI
jgi:hypothetical protein